MRQFRNTKQRQLVLDAVLSRCDHPSADQIYLDVRGADDKISRGTVYRNLSILVKSGEILQVKAPNADRYDNRLGVHYHLMCSDCGCIADLDFPYEAQMDKTVEQQTGFIVRGHHCIFEGTCPDCQSNEKSE